jgi:hypothetical protein
MDASLTSDVVCVRLGDVYGAKVREKFTHEQD